MPPSYYANSTSLGPVGVARLLACKECRADIADMEDFLSRGFRGAQCDRAALFDRAKNLVFGPHQVWLMLSGAHTVRELHCSSCGAYLGWQFVRAHEKSEKWKDGGVVLELDFVVGRVVLEGDSTVTERLFDSRLDFGLGSRCEERWPAIPAPIATLNCNVDVADASSPGSSPAGSPCSRSSFNCGSPLTFVLSRPSSRTRAGTYPESVGSTSSTPSPVRSSHPGPSRSGSISQPSKYEFRNRSGSLPVISRDLPVTKSKSFTNLKFARLTHAQRDSSASSPPTRLSYPSRSSSISHPNSEESRMSSGSSLVVPRHPLVTKSKSFNNLRFAQFTHSQRESTTSSPGPTRLPHSSRSASISQSSNDGHRNRSESMPKHPTVIKSQSSTNSILSRFTYARSTPVSPNHSPHPSCSVPQPTESETRNRSGSLPIRANHPPVTKSKSFTNLNLNLNQSTLSSTSPRSTQASTTPNSPLSRSLSHTRANNLTHCRTQALSRYPTGPSLRRNPSLRSLNSVPTVASFRS